MAQEDDLLGDDPTENAALEAYQRDRDDLQDAIADYLQEFEIDSADAVHMLLDIAIGMRIALYGFGVQNPSAAGLKLDLDRLGREVADLLRETKKDAEAQINDIKQTIAKGKAAAQPVGEAGEADGEDEEGRGKPE